MNVRLNLISIIEAQERPKMSEAIAKLRWIKKDNKTICEAYIDNEWIEYIDTNKGKMDYTSLDGASIRFKGITDNAYRER